MDHRKPTPVPRQAVLRSYTIRQALWHLPPVNSRKSNLGIQPGEKIERNLLPDGEAELNAPKRRRSWPELHGMHRSKGNCVRLSIKEISYAIAEAGAAAGMAGF